MLVALIAAACSGGDSGQTVPSGSRSAEPTPVRVWAYGDGPDGEPAATAVARFVTQRSPEAVLYLGDVYGAYASRMDALFGELGLAARTLPTPGNHDWPRNRSDYLTYWSDVLGRPMAPYYSRRLGTWQVLSLNSEIGADPGSRQQRWLEQQVRKPGTCRLAFWHRPRFSASQHGDYGKVDGLWKTLSGRAVLVLSGHDHTMQEMQPKDGVVQLVSGAGGHSSYPVDDSDPRLVWGDDKVDGALSLELGARQATWQFFSVDGEMLREGSIPCQPLGRTG